MKNLALLSTLILVVLSLVGWGAFDRYDAAQFGSQAWINQQVRTITARAPNLDSSALRYGLKAYVKVREKGLDQKQLLTLIDFSQYSSQPRLWVINLRNDTILFNTWVAHGKNSGGLKATAFSNRNQSLESSLGAYITKDTYFGGEGYSLRLVGLEPGFNDHAYSRSIVMHGAWYVGRDVVRKYGQLGRSWGCPAVSERVVKPLINTIKDNTLIFMYYPDRNYLRRSTYVS